jgi:hypothetical protein
MTRRLHLAFLLIVALPIGSAIAQAPSAAPVFSTEEQTVIRRNAALNDLLPRDPVLVRKVLDAIAFTKTGGARSNDGKSRKPERPPNPKSNPDLENFGRASPEAAHDLFQLIKKAGQKRQSSSSR